jgi:hypothetical protein
MEAKMLTGKIFEEITGRSVNSFKTTSEIWGAVVASRPTVQHNNHLYASGIVSKRGGVFRMDHYDFDIDEHINSL